MVVALTEFLQSFEELVCFVASLSQKLGDVVASGLPRRLVASSAASASRTGSLRDPVKATSMQRMSCFSDFD